MENFLKTKKKVHGFSLMEIILTISISLFLITASFFFYKMVAERYKQDRATKELALIKNSIESLTENHLTYVNNDLLLKTKTLPENMINGNKIINPWNGNITISTNPNDQRFYNIGYSNLTPDACIKMVSGSKSLFETVRTDSNELTSNKINDISDFCSKLKNNEQLVFSNYNSLIAAASTGTFPGNSEDETAASVSTSVSNSVANSVSTSTSISNSISASISTSSSVSISNSIAHAASLSNSTAASLSTSASLSASTSLSISVSNSISASTSASRSTSVSSSTSFFNKC